MNDKQLATMDISAKNLLRIVDSDFKKYKLYLASENEEKTQPLDVYLQDWKKWVGWIQYKGSKNDFNREYIFSLIKNYHEPNKWIFGGIFRVLKRLPVCNKEGGYQVELVDLHKELIGRLIIDFNRPRGMQGRSFRLENYYKDFVVSEILQRSFDGINFPGYENISIDFSELETVFKYQKSDWKGALQNVKGVYVIVDKFNGKKYIGSAYGDSGIWSRWEDYFKKGQKGHGNNAELKQLISKKGISYAKDNFRFSLLEYRSMKTDDGMIIERESYWKDILLTNEFGYNKN